MQAKRFMQMKQIQDQVNLKQLPANSDDNTQTKKDNKKGKKKEITLI